VVFLKCVENSTVIPGELAIKLQPPADQPPAEARPGIQENQKPLDTRFRGYDGGEAAHLFHELWFQDISVECETQSAK
jgi:hypothetical protein